MHNSEHHIALPQGRIMGTVCVPNGKSELLRWLITRYILRLEGRIRCSVPCHDVRALLSALQCLGMCSSYSQGVLHVTWSEGATAKSLQCGESAFLARVLPFLFSGEKEVPTLEGKGTLSTRNQLDTSRLLHLLSIPHRLHGETLPLKIAPYTLPSTVDCRAYEGVSSQPISGLLLGLVHAHSHSRVALGTWAQQGYVQLTLQAIQQAGIKVHPEGEWLILSRTTPSKHAPTNLHMAAGDWSAGAMLMAGVLLTRGKLSIKGLDAESPHPDRRIVTIIESLGIPLRWDADHTLHIDATLIDALPPFDVDITGSPDLAPALTILGCACQGTSHIQGMRLLRNKESARDTMLASILQAFGVPHALQQGVLSLQGGHINRQDKRVLTACGDHRMAMTIGILALQSNIPTWCNDPHCVEKSWPTFWDTLQRIVSPR